MENGLRIHWQVMLSRMSNHLMVWCHLTLSHNTLLGYHCAIAPVSAGLFRPSADFIYFHICWKAR